MIAPGPWRLLGMTTSSFDPASRFRFVQFIPHLRRAGWDVVHRPNRPDRQWRSPFRQRVVRGLHYRAARLQMKWNRWRDLLDAAEFHVVFVNRDLAGQGSWFQKQLFKRNHRVVFDFDDAIFLGRNEPNVRWTCEAAAWVTPGNEYLAEYARRFNPRVTIVPTVIDCDEYAARIWEDEPHGRNQLVRVGWSGSDQSIRSSLFPYLELLADIQRRIPFELVVITNTPPQLPTAGMRWTFHPWTPEGERSLSAQMDIGVMPLVDDDFQRGKCGLKLLQYMASGLPTVASPVGVNAHITVEGETGFLAATPAQWAEALAALVTDAHLRRSMGSAGRRRCEEHYSLRVWLPQVLRIFNQVGRCSGAEPACRTTSQSKVPLHPAEG